MNVMMPLDSNTAACTRYAASHLHRVETIRPTARPLSERGDSLVTRWDRSPHAEHPSLGPRIRLHRDDHSVCADKETLAEIPCWRSQWVGFNRATQ